VAEVLQSEHVDVWKSALECTPDVVGVDGWKSALECTPDASQ
jgi:hypothetical protein